jgi:hypothetical protein
VSGYQEFRFYSPVHDSEMVRVSMFNGEGHEFFVTIDGTYGKSYRKRLEDAVIDIEQAIVSGREPGEVRTS